jgi:hypothetical protein
MKVASITVQAMIQGLMSGFQAARAVAACPFKRSSLVESYDDRNDAGCTGAVTSADEIPRGCPEARMP